VSDDDSGAALRVRDVGKTYGNLTALASVSFDASAGEVLAIVGPNGAGKTTLLSIIAGTQRASSGTVVVGKVGWAPQQSAIYSRLTVAENLDLFARLERVGDPRGAVERMLAQTGLEARAGERVGRLSGGNRQRVNVALALLADPPVLALDEPSASLDPAQRERLWEFIKELAHGGRSVVFASHNMAEVQRHADRVIVLDSGAELYDGTAAGLIREAGDADGDLETALVAYIERRERREREAARGSEPAA
jgi:ABC-2 type transport system ATP-binding protein